MSTSTLVPFHPALLKNHGYEKIHETSLGYLFSNEQGITVVYTHNDEEYLIQGPNGTVLFQGNLIEKNEAEKILRERFIITKITEQNEQNETNPSQ